MKLAHTLSGVAIAFAMSASHADVTVSSNEPGSSFGTLTSTAVHYYGYSAPLASLAANTYTFELSSTADVYGDIDAFGFPITLTSIYANSAEGTFEAAINSDGTFVISGLNSGFYEFSVLSSEGFGYTGTIYSTAPAVPEPETYVLALAGFGIALASLKRRQTA